MYASIFIALAAGISLVMQTTFTGFRKCVCSPLASCTRTTDTCTADTHADDSIHPADTASCENRPDEPGGVFCSVDCRDLSVL
jgi:hypothetical protein